jgi:3-oxoacyl-[acyl-carrier protein] reductase
MEYMKTIAKYMGNLSPNILAAAVSPGAISVPGKYLNKIERENPDTLAKFFDDNKIPVRRLGTMKEVAEVISFLCDQSSRYLHGCNIQIDGGASN